MDANRKDTSCAMTNKPGANADVVTGAPGAHPAGVGAGAIGGGLAGAVIGTAAAGPIGAAVGAVAGALAGGLVGKTAAEVVNPTSEEAFWRAEFASRPYYTVATPFEQYCPAYQYGWESFAAHTGKSFNDAEAQMAADWENRRGQSKLTWESAKAAALDAWHRVEKAASGRTCCSA